MLSIHPEGWLSVADDLDHKAEVFDTDNRDGFLAQSQDFENDFRKEYLSGRRPDGMGLNIRTGKTRWGIKSRSQIIDGMITGEVYTEPGKTDHIGVHMAGASYTSTNLFGMKVEPFLVVIPKRLTVEEDFEAQAFERYGKVVERSWAKVAA